MFNVKCSQIYKKGGKIGDWLDDHLLHEFNTIKYDGYFLYRICDHCGVREKQLNNFSKQRYVR